MIRSAQRRGGAPKRPPEVRRVAPPTAFSRGADAESAKYFKTLLAYFDTPHAELARRLRCSENVLDALSSGSVRAVPWPEVARVVTALSTLANIDPRTPLRMAGRAWASAPAAVVPSRPVRTEPEPRARRMSWRAAFYACAILGPAAFLLVAFNSFDIEFGGAEQAASAGQSLLRFVSDREPPSDQGLRWIETADPRSRRTDKLPVKAR